MPLVLREKINQLLNEYGFSPDKETSLYKKYIVNKDIYKIGGELRYEDPPAREMYFLDVGVNPDDAPGSAGKDVIFYTAQSSGMFMHWSNEAKISELYNRLETHFKTFSKSYKRAKSRNGPVASERGDKI